MHHPLAQCLQVSTSPILGPTLSTTPVSCGPTSCASFTPTISNSSSSSIASCALSLFRRWSSPSIASVADGGPAPAMILARTSFTWALTSTSSATSDGPRSGPCSCSPSAGHSSSATSLSWPAASSSPTGTACRLGPRWPAPESWREPTTASSLGSPPRLSRQ